jgi:hypothetical protein
MDKYHVSNKNVVSSHIILNCNIILSTQNAVHQSVQTCAYSCKIIAFSASGLQVLVIDVTFFKPSNDVHINGCHRHSPSNLVTVFAHFQASFWEHGVVSCDWSQLVIVGRKLQGKNKEALFSYWPTDVPGSSSSLYPSVWLLHLPTCGVIKCRCIRFPEQGM